ncbi:hypothetical protein N7494_011887 [Penicillium frequentans]|uniref:Uncharacterized protein n=1 Tax=Penicillium frequentans TaxID=3151616 RepID=A0AAD6CKI7_9EURO|nr:hypothetical protein N7494_011887 [Penicillium glabrum]
MHELTHADSYFNSKYRHDDQDLNNGNKAYQWAGVAALAKEDQDVKDISQVRALYNAVTQVNWLPKC